jgi:hypothetical protein
MSFDVARRYDAVDLVNGQATEDVLQGTGCHVQEGAQGSRHIRPSLLMWDVNRTRQWNQPVQGRRRVLRAFFNCEEEQPQGRHDG